MFPRRNFLSLRLAILLSVLRDSNMIRVLSSLMQVSAIQRYRSALAYKRSTVFLEFISGTVGRRSLLYWWTLFFLNYIIQIFGVWTTPHSNHHHVGFSYSRVPHLYKVLKRSFFTRRTRYKGVLFSFKERCCIIFHNKQVHFVSLRLFASLRGGRWYHSWWTSLRLRVNWSWWKRI